MPPAGHHQFSVKLFGLEPGRRWQAGRAALSPPPPPPKSHMDWSPRGTPKISGKQPSLPGPGFRRSSVWARLAEPHSRGRSREPRSAPRPNCLPGPQGPCCAPDYVLGARDSEKLGNIPYLELSAQWERRHLNRSLKDVAWTLNELGMHRRIWALNQPGRKSQGWLPGGGDSSKR